MRTREQIENEMLERKIGVEARDGNIRAELGSAIANELMLETLLDIREILMNSPSRNGGYSSMLNVPHITPVSEKETDANFARMMQKDMDSVEEARKACGCDKCLGIVGY